jgi:formamidopyrimidine-DNA glycosylase
MPELPEAETIARDLARGVVGRTIEDVEVVHPDVLEPPLTPQRLRRQLRHRHIQGVGRRGKNVVLDVGEGERLVVNLGMTGRLLATAAPAGDQWRHVAVRFRLDGGRWLLYDDVRRFGRLDLLDAAGWQRRNTELGVEPLSHAFTPASLYQATRTSRSPIRNWLLDQKRIAGIGNIYASEALFRARVRPARPANSLTRPEATRLHAGIREVLEASIAARGTTISDYRDGNGEQGAFAILLQVYDRAGKPCLRCGRPIQRIVLSSRSAFFCPHCQK